MAKPGKKKKVLFVLEIIVLLLFIGGLYVYGQISSRLDKIEQPELKKEKIVVNQEAPKMTGYKTYVLFGIDTRGEGSQYSAQNSDTMIIVSVNNDTKEVRMISDTEIHFSMLGMIPIRRQMQPMRWGVRNRRSPC